MKSAIKDYGLLSVFFIIGFVLMLLNQKLSHWPDKKIVAPVASFAPQSFSRVEEALRLAQEKNLPLKQRSDMTGTLYTPTPVSVIQVNAWLEQLNVKNILPEALLLHATQDDNGELIIEKAEFK